MKIWMVKTTRVLFEGKDLALASYYDYNTKKWYWIIFSESSISMEYGKQTNNDFELWLEQGKSYPYSAYESNMYCIYLGYKYDVENIWHGLLFILYPSERKTRRHLKLHCYDDSRIKVPYEEFIASSPIIWEEREPISDFVFDVEPLVYLFKDDSYIEENLHGAWQTEYQTRKMNNGCIRYSSIAILLIIMLLFRLMLLSRLFSHILSLLY